MKCACCGQESDILICLDPFTLPERPRLSDQPATYCCEYCGSIIIRELMQNRTEAKNKQPSTTDQPKMLTGKTQYVNRWGESAERDAIKFAVSDAYGQKHSFQIRWHDLGVKRSYRAEEIYRAISLSNNTVETSASPGSPRCFAIMELKPPIVSFSIPDIEPLRSRINTNSVIINILLCFIVLE